MRIGEELNYDEKAAEREGYQRVDERSVETDAANSRRAHTAEVKETIHRTRLETIGATADIASGAVECALGMGEDTPRRGARDAG